MWSHDSIECDLIFYFVYSKVKAKDAALLNGSMTNKNNGGYSAGKSMAIDNSFLMDDNSEMNKLIIPLTSTWKSYFDLWMVVMVGYSCFSTAF